MLALDATVGATFGDIRLKVQLTDAGGPGGLRGYLPGVLLGRANAIASVQFRDDYVSGLDWNLLHFTTVRGFAGTLFADAAAVSSCDNYSLSSQNVFYDVGYSFRVLHDAFGVYQQLLSVDLGIPLNPRPPTGTLPRLPADAGVADLHRADHVLPELLTPGLVPVRLAQPPIEDVERPERPAAIALSLAVLGLPAGEHRPIDEPELPERRLGDHRLQPGAASGPRSQAASGIPKPFFGRSITASGICPRAARLSRYLLWRPGSLVRDGSENAKSTSASSSSGGRTSSPCAIDARSTLVRTEPDM